MPASKLIVKYQSQLNPFSLVYDIYYEYWDHYMGPKKKWLNFYIAWPFPADRDYYDIPAFIRKRELNGEVIK